jgi:hypothetical protein
VLIGTPGYMAPEQAGGRPEEIGPATDVHALGVLLYELLTGRPPYQGANDVETVQRVSTAEPVPPGRLRPGVARDLETICLTCLHKDPSRRYATAALLSEDLRAYIDGRPVRARRPRAWERASTWARRRPAATALVAVSILAAAGSAYGLWLIRDASVTADRLRRRRFCGRSTGRGGAVSCLGPNVGIRGQHEKRGRRLGGPTAHGPSGSPRPGAARSRCGGPPRLRVVFPPPVRRAVEASSRAFINGSHSGFSRRRTVMCRRYRRKRIGRMGSINTTNELAQDRSAPRHERRRGDPGWTSNPFGNRGKRRRVDVPLEGTQERKSSCDLDMPSFFCFSRNCFPRRTIRRGRRRYRQRVPPRS